MASTTEIQVSKYPANPGRIIIVFIYQWLSAGATQANMDYDKYRHRRVRKVLGRGVLDANLAR